MRVNPSRWLSWLPFKYTHLALFAFVAVAVLTMSAILGASAGYDAESIEDAQIAFDGEYWIEGEGREAVDNNCEIENDELKEQAEHVETRTFGAPSMDNPYVCAAMKPIQVASLHIAAVVADWSATFFYHASPIIPIWVAGKFFSMVPLAMLGVVGWAFSKDYRELK